MYIQQKRTNQHRIEQSVAPPPEHGVCGLDAVAGGFDLSHASVAEQLRHLVGAVEVLVEVGQAGQVGPALVALLGADRQGGPGQTLGEKTFKVDVCFIKGVRTPLACNKCFSV